MFIFVAGPEEAFSLFRIEDIEFSHSAISFDLTSSDEEQKQTKSEIIQLVI